MNFRFTVRDLLWVTVVVAVVSAWFLGNAELTRERDYWKKQWESTRPGCDAAPSEANSLPLFMRGRV
jgi:hypothetical protein